MKIQQTCLRTDQNDTKAFSKVKLGTVFLYGSPTAGPYLRVHAGVIDLKHDAFYVHPESSLFFNFKELPNARLVLE